MTRLASILGIATVATLVLLSGCEQAMDRTDFVTDLEGTWVGDGISAMVLPPGQTTPLSGEARVEVEINGGEKLNTGHFKLTVTLSIPTNQQHLLPISAGGSILVGSKNIAVTIEEIMGDPISGPPAVLQNLQGEETDIGYEIADDSLAITHSLLQDLGLLDATVELTKSEMQ